MYDLPEPTFSFKSGPKMMQCTADKPVICKLSNDQQSHQPLHQQPQPQSNQQSHQPSNQQQQQQPQQQQLTKQSVKRALFVEKDEIDHAANLQLVQKQLDQLLAEDCERWNFDFKNNRPLNNVNSQYEWFVSESVLSKLDLNRSVPIDEPIKSSRPATATQSTISAVRGQRSATSNPISKQTAAGKLSNSNSTNTSIATRSTSLKRKLMNIDGTCPAYLFFLSGDAYLAGLSHLLLILPTIYQNVLVFVAPAHASRSLGFIIRSIRTRAGVLERL